MQNNWFQAGQFSGQKIKKLSIELKEFRVQFSSTDREINFNFN